MAFSLTEATQVSVMISNVVGQRISNVITKDLHRGQQEIAVATNELAPGVYLITVKTNNGISQFKFVKD